MRKTQADPIIEEVRAIRDEYAARFDYDVTAIFRDLRARQDASEREHVCHSARRVVVGDDGPAEA